MQQFVIGIDYGTESARGVLLDAASGELLATCRHAYAHGVMTDNLPDGTPLAPQWALQDADDYMEAAEVILTELSGKARDANATIAGIGIDSTASSPMPARADGTPLSRSHPHQPHAYVKLWKHHAAQPWADRLNASGDAMLANYGGQTSCEWLPAKAAQMADEAPALWAETERFIEAGDWIVWQLTGVETRSECQAGYKAHYQPATGYPDVLDWLTPGLRQRLESPTRMGQSAGPLQSAIRDRTDMPGQPAVAVSVIDAHVVVPAAGVSQPGSMVCTLGTSACQLTMSRDFRHVPGVAGTVYGGVLPAIWGYETGQASFGDLLGWFVRRFPAGDSDDASFAFYEDEAARLAPGESGVLALDWWNGCRTPLMDSRLSGLFVGMTLDTRPADLYRAAVESLCFGTRRVVETLTEGGLVVDRLVLTSGMAERSPFLNQLMADVTGLSAHVPAITEATARGAAIHGAVASGIYPDFKTAIDKLGAKSGTDYTPRPDANSVYSELYGVYRQLSKRMAEGDEMDMLRACREAALAPD